MILKIAILSTCLCLTACGEYASRQAGEGAAMGAASGAVGGMVSAIIFGGDPVEAAARGAVYAGAAGATAGAIRGSQVDANISAQRKAKEDQIRAEIGDNAFKGLSALISCDYQTTAQYADNSKNSENPNFAVAGYWLELLIFADRGDLENVNQLIPAVITKDWDTTNDEQARAHLGQLEEALTHLREEYKQPAHCSK